MAPSNNFPVGYKFHPRDEELVEYYLYNKVRGAPFGDEHVIPEIDLYGSMEARDIWNNNGGQNLENGEDLYFFTKLKPASAKGTGSRIARTIGSGTWKGENSGTKVEDPKTGKTIGFLKRFQYRNTKFRQESGCWIMHEFSLDPKLVRHIKSSSITRQNNDAYVVCRIRKNYDRKRKADDRDHDREEATRVVQSKRNKIQRLSENIDESYVAPMSSEVNIDHYNQQQQQQTNINATSTSSSIALTTVDQPQYFYHEPAQYYEVINQYDVPLQQEQTTTTIDHSKVTNLPTGLTEQQRYFVTQDLTVASSSLAMPDDQQQQMHLPQYYHDTQEPMTPMTAMARPYDFIAEACLSQPNSIADPTMASSLGMARQEDYLQHNGFVNNASTDMPQYYYSSTQDPRSGADSSQYDPQTGTTGFADQAHYFVTQDHQPDYIVADPTAASSPASPSNLDQNHQINDNDQNPLLNFDYTQFYDCDGDDIMIDLDDLWNSMDQPAAVL